jgi:hypothetical protein
MQSFSGKSAAYRIDTPYPTEAFDRTLNTDEFQLPFSAVFYPTNNSHLSL